MGLYATAVSIRNRSLIFPCSILSKCQMNYITSIVRSISRLLPGVITVKNLQGNNGHYLPRHYFSLNREK